MSHVLSGGVLASINAMLTVARNSTSPQWHLDLGASTSIAVVKWQSCWCHEAGRLRLRGQSQPVCRRYFVSQSDYS